MCECVCVCVCVCVCMCVCVCVLRKSVCMCVCHKLTQWLIKVRGGTGFEVFLLCIVCYGKPEICSHKSFLFHKQRERQKDKEKQKKRKESDLPSVMQMNM